ncbi:TrkA family potassium uptake protein [Sporichthya sp.]|uniref:potassium channel family protein n=1 Tax=Sporichthya sp. TaxID=65475 RepID=UPI0018121DBB|nr:TrkA family potassium uptake protein [Sporichthya sp.]MBA3742743.1 TrkA family potassium uptake protein [Sporichthya sp.]
MGDRRKDAVVVIGLGRFGSALALELVREDVEVMAIDSRREIVQRMAGRLTHVVTADSTDLDTLRELGIGEFRRAVVAIGSDMQASILTTSLLVELGIPDIWAKAMTEPHGRILERVGAHHVVFPEHEMGQRVAHTVQGKMLDYIEMDADFAMIKMLAPASAIGVPLNQSPLRRKYKITVVAVKHAGGDDFAYATADTVLQIGDVIYVFGRTEHIEGFSSESS